jgi:pimeloyl-ACP methyl ester carboxylesterase
LSAFDDGLADHDRLVRRIGKPRIKSRMAEEYEETMIATNGITLHVAQDGPEDGPLVLLLHGFPEPWLGWRHQIGPLAGAGFRVLAPDQRGYGRSDKPRRVAAYALDVLAADVLGLIEAAGRQKAALVGHDWGGIVAWWVALRYPDRVERLAVLNAPHPVAFRRSLLHHPAQLVRSWYIFFFQIPRIPEAHFRRRNWRALARALHATSRPGTFTDEDLDRYRRAWAEPGAITAMIHWYRAALRHGPTPPADLRVPVPTLLIWGVRDRFAGRGLAEASLGLCDDGRLEWIEEATHWVQHEEPDRVNRLLLDFLGRHPDGGHP